MIWIILLLVMVGFCVISGRNLTGNKYSAGKHIFHESEYDISEDKGKKDFYDFQPFNYDDEFNNLKNEKLILNSKRPSPGILSEGFVILFLELPFIKADLFFYCPKAER